MYNICVFYMYTCTRVCVFVFPPCPLPFSHLALFIYPTDQFIAACKDILLSFLKTALLRCSLHTIKFTSERYSSVSLSIFIVLQASQKPGLECTLAPARCLVHSARQPWGPVCMPSAYSPAQSPFMGAIAFEFHQASSEQIPRRVSETSGQCTCHLCAAPRPPAGLVLFCTPTNSTRMHFPQGLTSRGDY